MRVLPVFVLLLLALPAQGHDLRYEVTDGDNAVSVRLFFADGNAFSFKSYEIYRDGEKSPFQVGRTDALGRVVFLPDRPGGWRVKAFSEDGHGVDFSLSTGAAGEVRASGKPLIDRYPRVITGVALIFGLFGLVDLLVRPRKIR